MMMLYEYQERLMDKERLVKEMELALPLTELRALKAQFEQEKREFLQKQKNMADLKREADLRDDRAKGILERTAALEKKLYDGAITNGRELSQMEAHIALLRQDREEEEKEGRKLRGILERESRELGRIAATLKQRQQQFEELKTLLNDKKVAYEQRIALVSREIEVLMGGLDQEELRWFHGEREGYRGTPLALLEEGGVCNGCHRRNPAFLVREAIARPKTVRCDFCGRFLCG